MVLFSTSKNGLQKALDKLYDYCQKWGLQINSEKNKTMIFGIGKMEKLLFNGIKINQVDSYTYLGVTIHKSGNIKHSIKYRINKASRAINMIKGALSACGNINVNVAISFYEKQILPILTYGSIFWVCLIAIINYI